MPIISLPDGATRQFACAVTVSEIAKNISHNLANAAIAGKVNDKLVDLTFIVEQDAKVQIITAADPEGLAIIRHSCAHLLAQAVQQLYPGVQVTIGPVVEDGFYYDFAYPTGFTPEDLVIIEKKMQELVKQDLPVQRQVMTREAAIEFFAKKGENYKVELVEAIAPGQELSFYAQGDFIDLCRGPHVPSTSKIKAFKLMKVAGAYWRGDSNNAMLQRIYGTAFADSKSLANYLHCLAEAEKRDHRKLAKKHDLLHFQDEAPGMVFWHAKGWAIYQVIEQYVRKKIVQHGYQELKTPQLIDRTLWEKSGHWEKYRENMFTLEADDCHYALKPMNCPGHIQIYNQGLKSYRDLPLRYAEFGACHRYEASGALHGLMRVRNFTQDDGHIFCTEEQLQAEVLAFIKLLFEMYADFGFTEIMVNLSTRPAKRVGSDLIWDKAEQALENALKITKLPYKICAGDGAFYGPKIDFALKDSLCRVWQCGTMQVDFSMPERLQAYYIAEDGSKKVPVILHRAVLGSLERFIGILLEETAGALPVWLAPHQVAVLTITDEQANWAKEIAFILKNNGFRVLEDLRNEKIGFKIREHTIQKVPYLAIVGAREVENKTLTVRTLEGIDKGAITIEQFIKQLSLSVEKLGRK